MISSNRIIYDDMVISFFKLEDANCDLQFCPSMGFDLIFIYALGDFIEKALYISEGSISFLLGDIKESIENILLFTKNNSLEMLLCMILT